MKNLTIRNIPDEVIEKIRILSEIERRSLNSEILIIIEKGLSKEMSTHKEKLVSKSTQIRMWENLSGLWEDTRSTADIIEDIYSSRTNGRDINL